MNTLTKGLIMTVVTLLATTITQTGLPSTVTGWEILGITTLGTVVIYLGKNAAFPSISVLGTVDMRDLRSGLFIALGSGISNWVADLATNTVINWHQFLTLMGATAIGYFAKNFATQNKPA